MLNENLYVVHLFDSQSFEAVITMTFDKTNGPFVQLKKIKIWPDGGKCCSRLEYIIVCTKDYVSEIDDLWDILAIANGDAINLNDFNNDFNLYFNHLKMIKENKKY